MFILTSKILYRALNTPALSKEESTGSSKEVTSVEMADKAVVKISPTDAGTFSTAIKNRINDEPGK